MDDNKIVWLGSLCLVAICNVKHGYSIPQKVF